MIQVVRGREQKRKIAGSTHRQEEQQAHHFVRRRLVGVAGGRVRGGVNRGSGLKKVLKMVIYHNLSDSDGPRKAGIRAESGNAHRTNNICHTLAPQVFFFVTTTTFARHNIGNCLLNHLLPSRSQSTLCLVFRAQTFANLVGETSSA